MAEFNIPYGRQIIDEDDLEAVRKVLQSPFLTQGPVVPTFENAVCQWTGADHAVASNSATSALHVACLALGLGQGDRLWTSPNSFVASANCARYCGAEVDFVDIDPQTFNMSVEALANKLETAAKNGTLPKVIIPVHLTGQSCQMQEIAALCNPHGIRIVEDASHAIGASYQDKPVGDCRYSDITVFSFHPVKIITTGEGGLATTNDASLAERMALFRSHGITRDKASMKGSPPAAWYYEQIELGYNYRMTDLHAALGISQMNKLSEFVASRRDLAQWYTDEFSDLPLTLPHETSESVSSWHLYVLGMDQVQNGKSRDEIFAELRAAGLGVNLHYYPVHLQPYYQALGFRKGDFPGAEAYAERSISIPMYARMSEPDREKVATLIQQAVT